MAWASQRGRRALDPSERQRRRENTMSAGIQEIEAVRDAAFTQLQGLLELAAPTVVTADGPVPWTPWLAHLQNCIDWCDRKRLEVDPYEVQSPG